VALGNLNSNNQLYCTLPCTLNGALNQIEGDDVAGFFGHGYITGCGNTGTTQCGSPFTRTCGPVTASAATPRWTCSADAGQYFHCRISRPPACSNGLRSTPGSPVENECPSMAVSFNGCVSTTGIQLVGGSGSYTMSTNASCGSVPGLCAGASSTGMTAPPAACSLSASGSYVNIVCGTATTGGFPATSDAGTLMLGSTSTTINFGMVMVDGLAFISGEAIASDGTTDVAEGVAMLTPVSGNCVTPVTTLSIVGELTIG
jgi:hypothetical protein